jgi:hypothetical protein
MFGCWRIFFLFLLIFPRITFSQSDTVEITKEIKNRSVGLNGLFFNKYDSTYISKLPTKIVYVLCNPNWMDDYVLKNKDNEKLEFQSDLIYNLGTSLGYKMLYVYYSVNISNFFSDYKLKNKEFDFSLTSNFMNLEFYYFSNRGQTNLKTYTEGQSVSILNKPFDGLNSGILDICLFYFLNHKRYSNTTIYSSNHEYIQIKSAGSLILGLSYTNQKIKLDFSDLKSIGYTFDNFTQFIDNHYRTFCFNAGYGYNFVINKHLLANITLIPSFGVRTDVSSTGDYKITLGNKGKIGLMYTKNIFFVGLNCQYNSSCYFSNDYTITSSLGIFNVFCGMFF